MTRDAYCLFWNEIKDSHFMGSRERVPSIRHELFEDEWLSIGKILLKGFLDCQYLPLFISQAFLTFCFFGSVEDTMLIESFKNYLCRDEQEVVENLVKCGIENQAIEPDEDTMNFLDNFKCNTLPNSGNVESIVAELARQELLQKPHLMISAWRKAFQSTLSIIGIENPIELAKLYEQRLPTAKKLLSIIISEPKNAAERDADAHFKRYVKGLEQEDLKKLLTFITGSDQITVNTIRISFVNHYNSEFSRVPVAHTCAPLLELPSTYRSFCELRQEFSAIIRQSSWEMDIV